jgi:hypothetical protein
LIILALKILGYNTVLASGIILFAIGIGTYVSAFLKYRKLRHIRDTQTSKIGSAPMGFVEICGKAKRISGVGYIYRIFTIKELESSSNSWFNSINRQEYSVNPFYIEDGTGLAYIDPSEAEIIVDTKRWSDADYSYEECEIKEGDEVYCLGTAGGANESDLKEKIYAALKSAKTDKNFYAKYDADGDGKISAQEWDYARRDITGKTIDENNVFAKGRLLEINKSPHDKIFIISNKSEKALISGFLTKTLIMLFGGIFLTAVAIFDAFVKLNVFPAEAMSGYFIALKNLNFILSTAAYALIILFILFSYAKPRLHSIFFKGL